MRVLYVPFCLVMLAITSACKAMDPGSGAISPCSASAADSFAGPSEGFYHPDINEQRVGAKLPDYIQSIQHPKQLWPIFAACLAQRKKGQRVVGVFDVDDTLGRCTDESLGENVYAQNILVRLTTVPLSKFLYPLASIFADHFELMRKSGMQPLPCDPENSMSQLIEYFYDQGVLFLGATSRSEQYSEITAQKHLKECLGIDFDRTLQALGLPGLEITFGTSPKTAFSHAIAFCSGTPKAPIVQEVLRRLNIQDPLMVYVDDKIHHVENMHRTFGASVIPVHLNAPEEPPTIPDSPTLLYETLSLPYDTIAHIKGTIFSRLTRIGLAQSPEGAKACSAIIEEIFDHLKLPKSQKLSTEEIDALIKKHFTDKLNEFDKKQLVVLCNNMQKRIKLAAPYFGFFTYGGKEYVAIHVAKQDENHQLITEVDGETLVYDAPIILPVELLYKCNERYLRARDRYAERPRRNLMRRTLSHADWPRQQRESPPSTPGPATPGIAHSWLFSPRSPQHKTPPNS